MPIKGRHYFFHHLRAKSDFFPIRSNCFHEIKKDPRSRRNYEQCTCSVGTTVEKIWVILNQSAQLFVATCAMNEQTRGSDAGAQHKISCVPQMSSYVFLLLLET